MQNEENKTILYYRRSFHMKIPDAQEPFSWVFLHEKSYSICATKELNFQALNSEWVFLTADRHCLFDAAKFIPLAFFVIDKRY